MLPRRFHLNLRSERDFFQTAEKQYAKYVTVYQKSADTHLQIAIVVPKRAVQLSVQRNYTRRRLSSELCKYIPELEQCSGKLAIVVRRSIPTDMFGEVGRQLVQYIHAHATT